MSMQLFCHVLAFILGCFMVSWSPTPHRNESNSMDEFNEAVESICNPESVRPQISEGENSLKSGFLKNSVTFCTSNTPANVQLNG